MRLSPCTVALSCLSRNARKCRMVMDRFEVLGFYHVTRDTAVTIERQRNVAHQILDELGIVIGTLGYVFFIGALEQSIHFAGSAALGNFDQFLDCHLSGKFGLDPDMLTLVMRAIARNLFRAWA